MKKERFSNFISRIFSKSKLTSLYVILVVIPLILADLVFGWVLVNNEKSNMEHEYENDANTFYNQMLPLLENASNFAIEIEMNQKLNDFLNTNYRNNAEYYDAYLDITSNSFLETRGKLNYVIPKLYVDNDTIVSGGEFSTLDSAKNNGWYEEFMASGKSDMLVFYFDDDMLTVANDTRRLFYIKKFKTYGTRKRDIIARIEINYSSLAQMVESNRYDSDVLLCKDGKILLSGVGGNKVYQDFAPLSQDLEIGYRTTKSGFGSEFEIIALERNSDVMNLFWRYRYFLLVILVINVLFPLMFTYLMQVLQHGRLKEREMDIARQKAELLALHSQINPHFLFNALESIRMHSILRNENETAQMVEKLAIIERKNADWNEDFIEIRNEMEFTDAYLGLQKYRFGDRLNYEINVEPLCNELRIPKLTIVTFVENACVHGIEGKSTPGWIFVSIGIKDENLIVEVEDTGEGISEKELEELRTRIENASIDDLKHKGRIGMINACLRLKMATANKVDIKFDSEEGVGTTVVITIPTEYCKQEDKVENA